MVTTPLMTTIVATAAVVATVGYCSFFTQRQKDKRVRRRRRGQEAFCHPQSDGACISIW